jgi:hypothetical protein
VEPCTGQPDALGYRMGSILGPLFNIFSAEDSSV